VATWNALARRWDRFADVLHHHHQVEDEYIWPVLERHAADDGETTATAMLHAMEEEHAQIDPALAGVEEAFRAMAAHPCADHRNALDVRVTAVRAALLEHLRHEETDALPYLQRAATPEEERPWRRGRSAVTRSPSLRTWCRGSPRRSRTSSSHRSSARPARCSF
jgi:hemerythrin-like domain-containing protein